MTNSERSRFIYTSAKVEEQISLSGSSHAHHHPPLFEFGQMELICGLSFDLRMGYPGMFPGLHLAVEMHIQSLVTTMRSH